MFLAKTLTFVIAVVAIVATIASAASKQKGKKGHLELIDLSEQFEETEQEIIHSLLTKEQLKKKEKADKKKAKAQAKADKKSDVLEDTSSKLFVVDFKGSIDAKEVSSLREEISAILMVAKEQDEVFVRLESGGGMVHGYGLASSQLDRLRQKKIPLTIAVDKVAASGGYMMACVADKIISAPFAIVGSIGVRILKKVVKNLLKNLKKRIIYLNNL